MMWPAMLTPRPFLSMTALVVVGSNSPYTMTWTLAFTAALLAVLLSLIGVGFVVGCAWAKRILRRDNSKLWTNLRTAVRQTVRAELRQRDNRK